MMSQCGLRRPNLNETKIRRRYDVACRVGLFFFINKFQLAILTDYHFESITIVQENFFLSFRDIG